MVSPDTDLLLAPSEQTQVIRLLLAALRDRKRLLVGAVIATLGFGAVAAAHLYLTNDPAQITGAD